ncbi:MAG: DciA family protein, partial [Pseudomonadota bacterium]
MATRAQRRAAPSLGNYSNRIVRGLAQTTHYMDPGLAERWTEMVGPELAALCRPGRLTGSPGSGRSLEVIVSNGAAATWLGPKTRLAAATISVWWSVTRVAAAPLDTITSR